MDSFAGRRNREVRHLKAQPAHSQALGPESRQI